MKAFTITCCETMQRELEADVLLCIMENVPFTTQQHPAACYLQSDSGHGGMARISFCPFCGKQIELVDMGEVDEPASFEERLQRAMGGAL